MKDLCYSLFEEIFAYDMFDNVSSVLNLNPSSEFSAVWTGLETVYNGVMIPVALGLMVIWFLVSFMEKSTSDQLTFEQMFMLFVKLIAAKYLIDHGFEIFSNLWSLGFSLVEQVGEAFVSDEPFSGFSMNDLWKSLLGFSDSGWDNFLTAISALGPLYWMGVLAKILVPWLASKAIIVVVYFICYTRLLEMLIRLLAAPIALADFISEGLHGAGWRFLKSFLAVCLQGMIIAAIAAMMPIMMSSVFVDNADFWPCVLKYLAFSFSACGLMFKSLSITKELVGVG